MADDEDRASAPSPRRIQMAREMGVLPMAATFVQAAGLISAIALVYFRGPALAAGLHASIDSTWRKLPELARGPMTAQGVRELAFNLAVPVAEPVLTVSLGSLAIMLIVHQWATGGAWTPTLALPNIGRLWKTTLFADEDATSNKPPITHRIVLGMLRPLAIFAGCGLLIVVLRSRWSTVPPSDEANHATLISVLRHGRVSLGLGLALLSVPLILLGLLEYVSNRICWFDRLRPTSDQARRELREIEGDTQWKSKRQKLVRRIREASTIETMARQAAMVVVGTGFSGLSVQLVRGPGGRLAVGQVLRGSISASFAEKAAAQGVPWVRDGKLAARLAGMAGKPGAPPAELPAVLAADIARRMARPAT